MLLPLILSLAHAEEHRLTFLHVNDVYEISPKAGWGGLAELETLLELERAKDPNALFTFGGDLISPSVLSSYTKGEHMIALMAALKVDVAVIGNHELDHGAAITQERITQSLFPWLGANVVGADGQPALGLVPTKVLDRNGLQVGFLGVLTPELGAPRESGLQITDPIAAAKAAAEKLVADGADVVVALTHMDIEDDLALARAVPQIDLILGGHDHHPITVLEGETLIHKSGSDARWLGVIELQVDPEAKTIVPSWRMVANHDTPPAPEVKASVDKFEKAVDERLSQPIGKLKVALDSRRHKVRTEETAIGNLIADAIRARMKADVAFTNGGGIRGDRTYDKGTELVAKDIVAELPFANTAVVIEMTGAQIQRSVEHAVSGYPEKEGRFLQVSGMAFTFDPGSPPGSRVQSLTVGGAPIDLGRTYRVATSDYLAKGGDGYTWLQESKVLEGSEEGPLLSALVIESLEGQKKIAPEVDGRIQLFFRVAN